MKKNIIIVILCLIVLTLISLVVYNLINTKDIKLEQKINITDKFKSFAESKNLKLSNNIYDLDALNKINCIEAISATGNDYSIELFKFNDENSAILEYNSQKNYQLNTNDVKQQLASNDKEHINYYEAILVPNLNNVSLVTGNEQIYLYKLRLDNFYISLYEVSTNSDKTDIIKIVEDLKATLNIK